MNEVNLVLWRQVTSELQLQGISRLIPVSGISSIWQSQNDMFQQMRFWTRIVFSVRGETRIVKKELISKNLKIFNYRHLELFFLNRSINFCFSFGFLAKSKIFRTIMKTFPNKNQFGAVTLQIISGKSFSSKNHDFVEKYPVFPFIKYDWVNEYPKLRKKFSRQRDSNTLSLDFFGDTRHNYYVRDQRLCR